MRLVAALFTLVQLALLALLTAASRHGPDGLAPAALVAGAVATLVTWLAARPRRDGRRARAWAGMLAVGMAGLGLQPLAYALLAAREERVEREKLEGTRIFDVRDEPLVSEAGHPIGVRVRFKARVARRDWYALVASVRPPAAPPGVWLFPIRIEQVRGDERRGKLEPGRDYEFLTDLVPGGLGRIEGRWCRSGDGPPPPPAAAAVEPWLVEIQGSRFGQPWRGGREERTARAYDLRAILEGAAREADAPCWNPPR